MQGERQLGISLHNPTRQRGMQQIPAYPSLTGVLI